MLSIFKKDTTITTESTSNIKNLAHDGHNYFSDELIVLDETLTGNLFCAGKVLVEQHGIINGNVTSKTCAVTGQVNGDILSLDLLDIKATAIVHGNIQSAKVSIEPGAVINGYITVGEDIEALTLRWNKTKFSTDQHLSAKLNKELSAINDSSNAVPITVEKPMTVKAAQTAVPSAPEPMAEQKPTVAPSAPAKGQQAPVFQEKAVSKPLVAAASVQQAPVVEGGAVKKPVVAAAPPKKEEDQNNNQRWW